MHLQPLPQIAFLGFYFCTPGCGSIHPVGSVLTEVFVLYCMCLLVNGGPVLLIDPLSRCESGEPVRCTQDLREGRNYATFSAC
jgi:hypothetical protein